MPRIEIVTLEQRAVCAFCCNEFGPNQIALIWRGVEFCTHDCLQRYADEAPHGQDFIAAQDQALAETEAQLARRPQNFVFLYDSEEADGIRATLLAQSEFLIACLPVIAQLAAEDGDVSPPD